MTNTECKHLNTIEILEDDNTFCRDCKTYIEPFCSNPKCKICMRLKGNNKDNKNDR